jgi:hypothetical protein
MSTADDDTSARLSKLLDVIENESDADGEPMAADESTLTSSFVLFLLGVAAGFVFIYSASGWLFQ